MRCQDLRTDKQQGVKGEGKSEKKEKAPIFGKEGVGGGVSESEK